LSIGTGVVALAGAEVAEVTDVADALADALVDVVAELAGV
jgi:hypothetical protein